MNRTFKAGMLAVLLLASTHLSAQESPFRLGVRLGGGMSVNKGINKILVPEDYYGSVLKPSCKPTSLKHTIS